MVNRSKTNDPRFWKLWKDSGAIADEYEADKRESIRKFRDWQNVYGNLTRSEIRELEKFEIRQGPESIEAQVRKDYLRVKSLNPESAERLLAKVQPILQEGISSVADVERLCLKLDEHIAGVFIRYNGVSYQVIDHKCYPVS